MTGVNQASRVVRDPGDPVYHDTAMMARRLDAVMGSRALLEAQVRYHQYPCKIAGEE